MAAFKKDDLPMLSNNRSQVLDDGDDSQSRRSWTRSASLSIAINPMESHEREASLVGHTGPSRSQRTPPFVPMSGPLYANRGPDNLFRPTQSVTAGKKEPEAKLERFPSVNGTNQNDWIDDNLAKRNEHLLRSGQLGMCNDPYYTTYPTYNHLRAARRKNSKPSALFDSHFHNAYGDAKGLARRFFSFLSTHIPGIMNPHAKVVQQWNQFFVISRLVAILIDPLFFFLLSAQKENKCIVLNWPMTTGLVVFRSITDFIYLMHIFLQFRLVFVAPESRVVGAGELVDHPKKIALNYLHGYFLIDFFLVLPLPQIIILLILPNSLRLLHAAILVQYTPRLYRFLRLLRRQSHTGFLCESAWGNFFINLLILVLSGHVVGSFWYFFGLQRFNKCLRDACHKSITPLCQFIYCGHGEVSDPGGRKIWTDNENATACLKYTDDDFPYGIYKKAVQLTTEDSAITRYMYSLFWGFQQISTLAGNLVPSYFVGEVVFTMVIIGIGLLLLAHLIWNLQNYLQVLGKRRFEMSQRRFDVEQWMSHRHLPDDLRRYSY